MSLTNLKEKKHEIFVHQWNFGGMTPKFLKFSMNIQVIWQTIKKQLISEAPWGSHKPEKGMGHSCSLRAPGASSFTKPELRNSRLLTKHQKGALQGINISHRGKRNIIFKMPFLGDMLVPWRVSLNLETLWDIQENYCNLWHRSIDHQLIQENDLPSTKSDHATGPSRWIAMNFVCWEVPIWQFSSHYPQTNNAFVRQHPQDSPQDPGRHQPWRLDVPWFVGRW